MRKGGSCFQKADIRRAARNNLKKNVHNLSTEAIFFFLKTRNSFILYARPKACAKVNLNIFTRKPSQETLLYWAAQKWLHFWWSAIWRRKNTTPNVNLCAPTVHCGVCHWRRAHSRTHRNINSPYASLSKRPRNLLFCIWAVICHVFMNREVNFRWKKICLEASRSVATKLCCKVVTWSEEGSGSTIQIGIKTSRANIIFQALKNRGVPLLFCLKNVSDVLLVDTARGDLCFLVSSDKHAALTGRDTVQNNHGDPFFFFFKTFGGGYSKSQFIQSAISV